MRIEDLCKEKILWEGGPVPEAFPEENVMELQEELFGDEEQPEDDSDLFQQSGFLLDKPSLMCYNTGIIL